MRHSISDADEVSMKGVCSVCGPVDLYRNTPYRGKAYFRCGPRLRKTSNERYSPKDQQRTRFARIYGISPDDYQQMLDDQGGVCARCDQPPGQLSLAVDHCHKTGRIRGLLCGACNTYLGRLEANLDRLEWDLNYVDSALAIPV